jgi:transcription antitermination factor NusG
MIESSLTISPALTISPEESTGTALLKPLSEWYAVAVKARHEKCVAEILGHKGLTAWLPMQERTHYYGQWRRVHQLPLFPGYVFCQLSLTAHMPVVTTPGVLRIVGAGRNPAPLDETEIQSIRTAAERNALLSSCEYLEGGQRVRIVAGPLAGVSGTVVSASRPFRVRLAVTLLQRAVLLEIDSDQLALEYV